MSRSCPYCEGYGTVDVVTGDACEQDDPRASDCEGCNGSGEHEPTQEEIDNVEGDRLFHLRHDEGEI